MLLGRDELSLEESVLFEIEEELATDVINIFNTDNELVASGNPANDSELRKLMNKADYLSEISNRKYFKISE